MNLLHTLGLMTRAEHEMLIERARDEEQHTIASLKAQLNDARRGFVDQQAKFKRAATDLAAQAEEIAELRDAADAVIDQATDYYTARNNRRMSIEGSDGEKCWIVPFDPFEHLRAVLVPAADRKRMAGKRGKA